MWDAMVQGKKMGLLLGAAVVLQTACLNFEWSEPDAGEVDAGDVDGGVVDGGMVDAGVVDAGVVDAGCGCGVGCLDKCDAGQQLDGGAFYLGMHSIDGGAPMHYLATPPGCYTNNCPLDGGDQQMVWSPRSDEKETEAVTNEWDGKTNTENLFNTLGDGGYAAKTCLDLDAAGFDDWFLPSIEELKKFFSSEVLANKLKLLPMSQPEYYEYHLKGTWTYPYWSSTESKYSDGNSGAMGYSRYYNPVAQPHNRVHVVSTGKISNGSIPNGWGYVRCARKQASSP